MWKPRRVIGIKTNHLEQIVDLSISFGSVADVVDVEWFANDREDPHPRIQRCVWILEDHLHLLSHASQIFRSQRRQVSIVKIHPTAGGTLEL